MTRTAFITGATAGIGAATARALVAAGWQFYRNRDKAPMAGASRPAHPSCR
jgi:NAD(P)-dependent dehydrogenase (short-subunit alcohol dehydrogenase family)